MILGRLFERLFELGVIVVATSNVAPADLYKDGLNRALFLPFIAMIEQHMEVIELKARTDFRLEKLAGQRVWYVPADDEATASLDEAWRRLVGSSSGMPQELSVKGRRLRVPRAAMGVARFFFHDLCEQPLAAADYLRIAHEFHTLIIDRIPVMGFDQRNAAKRFIILIDTLYDHAVKLIASAEAEPDALYEASDGFEAAEFKRTASRLIEMRSQSYLALPHGRRDSAAQRIERGDRRDLIVVRHCLTFVRKCLTCPHDPVLSKQSPAAVCGERRRVKAERSESVTASGVFCWRSMLQNRRIR